MSKAQFKKVLAANKVSATKRVIKVTNPETEEEEEKTVYRIRPVGWKAKLQWSL